MSCSGAFSFIDEATYEPRCGLCLSEQPCQYDCSGESSQYQTPQSKFYYVQVTACPIHTRSYATTLKDVSLEECKLFCTYYKTCEGFRLVSNILSKRNECLLMADLDFDGSCTDGTQQQEIYIPYVEDDSESFVNVGEELPINASAMFEHAGLRFD